jgi:putative CocE/NonD family hydrolase
VRILSILAVAGLLAAAAPEIRQELDLRVPMRDGVHLSTSVFRLAVPERLPTILVRTPYGKPKQLTPYYRGFVDRGYALVLQDVRGRYASEGFFDPPRQEVADGDDTLNWIARQAWSNGRIGMLGGSYLGIAQWKAALSRNPHLKAIFPVVAGCEEYQDRFYSAGGAMKLGQRLVWLSENLRAPGVYRTDFRKFIWSVPLRIADRAATGGRTVGFFQTVLDHPAYDHYWHSVSTCGQLDSVRVPAFITGGWYDNFVASDLEAFRLMRASGRTVRAMVGPWPHSMAYAFPQFSFGPEVRIPLRRWQLEWFDRYVRDGTPPEEEATGAPLTIFVMGANRWREEQEWPLARARQTSLYLSSGGKANTIAGDGTLRRRPVGAEPPDQFVYDPKKPVPTTGGAICCNPSVLPPGPLDQRPVERRRDVLVYTSEVLKDDLEVTGPIRVVLWVSSSGPDTDFSAKLVDVHPDGYARILTDGILRLRYRDSLAKPVAARPGGVYRITIDAGVTSNVFLAGHRIRLEVSSSNFPRFDRNPNTGRAVADEKEYRKANQMVFHDGARPSHLLLPVIPRATVSVLRGAVR